MNIADLQAALSGAASGEKPVRPPRISGVRANGSGSDETNSNKSVSSGSAASALAGLLSKRAPPPLPSSQAQCPLDASPIVSRRPPPPARVAGPSTTSASESLSASASASTPASTTGPDRLTKAVSSLDFLALTKHLLDEVEKLPYRKKKELKLGSNDREIVGNILMQMNGLLGQKFLHIDFNAKARDVHSSDWSTVCSCRRSDAGTTGIYFIQSTPEGDVGDEVIVAKPITVEDFDKQVFVNEMTEGFFNIQCPAIRFITHDSPEFSTLQTAVKKLFEPFNLELYETGGRSSPKGLFEAQGGIMLMELVKGNPLVHRTEGQRPLVSADFHAVGRLFLLDLLIRNTDRLPCRKALPRPSAGSSADQGNAGNLMFEQTPGHLWAIDPEMQVNL
jgi:Actin-fragmin kinase, catalytic